jgi:hypothetical protein
MDMPIDNTGTFIVKPGETITITVTASEPAYLAKFPKQPVGATWSSITGPTNLVESRQFVAPASGSKCFVSILFDFQSDATGAFSPEAKYDIKVEGSVSGSFDDFPVEPPPPDNRTYRFRTA